VNHSSGTGGLRRYLGFAGRYVLIYVRLLLGAWMLLNGLNHFVSVFPQPMGHTPLAGELMVSLIETGLFGLVKVTEILIGLMLIFELFVPLALILSMTISTVVWYNHAFLDGLPFHLSMGNGCLVFTVILLIAYLPYYLPMLKVKTEMGDLADLGRLPEIFSSAPDRAPESRHRLWTAMAGVLVTFWVFFDIHPKTPLPPGAGKIPAVIVREFLAMAYGQGQPTQAEKLYFSQDAIRHRTALPLARDGQPLSDQILKVVEQGHEVAVYHRVSDPQRSQPLEAVDFFETDRAGTIIDHSSALQPLAP
jgi:hypothetical protein